MGKWNTGFLVGTGVVFVFCVVITSRGIRLKVVRTVIAVGETMWKQPRARIHHGVHQAATAQTEKIHGVLCETLCALCGKTTGESNRVQGYTTEQPQKIHGVLCETLCALCGKTTGESNRVQGYTTGHTAKPFVSFVKPFVPFVVKQRVRANNTEARKNNTFL